MKISIVQILYYALLSVLVVVALLIVVSTFPITGNYKFLVVNSGSMEPNIKTGAFVMVKPVENYEIGDVITFKKNRVEEPITHRIYDIRVVEGEPYFITKGDANNAPDPREIRKKDIVGKVLIDIPYLGYAVDFVQKPVGFVLVIIVPALIIVIDEIRKIIKEIRKPKNKKENIE